MFSQQDQRRIKNYSQDNYFLAEKKNDKYCLNEYNMFDNLVYSSDALFDSEEELRAEVEKINSRAKVSYIQIIL